MEKERFENLIKYAEEYVRDRAKVISLLNNNSDILDVIKEKYAPENFNAVAKDEERINLILKRFCIELQNYRNMSVAINYDSFGKNYQNEIFKFVKSEYKKKLTSIIAVYQGLHEVCGFDEEKNLSKALENRIGDEAKKLKGKKVNNSWLRYSIGLKNAMDFLHDDGLEKLRPYFETGKKLNINIFKNIYYMGNALTRDFFKELGRVDLIKPDVHIRNLMKIVEISKDVPTDDETVKIFEKYCKEVERRYYIDKLLWLCCTGEFYKDNIKISEMNRKSFIDFYKKNK